MKRPLETVSFLAFLLPLPFLLRESSLFFAAWSFIEFALSFAAGRLELKGRLDRRGRAQAELVIRTVSLPLTVLLLEAAGALLLAALLRYALTCGIAGYLRLRWLLLFLFLFPAGSAVFALFHSYPEIPLYIAGPLFAASCLGAAAGLLLHLLRQERTLRSRAFHAMKRSRHRLEAAQTRMHEMLRLQMDESDARLFARGGGLASRDAAGIVFSLYLRESPASLENLTGRDFDREWEQCLEQIRHICERYAMTIFPEGSCFRFLRTGQAQKDQTACLSGAEEILALQRKTRVHYASLQKSWPHAFGFLSRCEVREVSAGPGVPRRLLLGSVFERHDRAAMEAWNSPDRERWCALPMIDENLPDLRARVERDDAHLLGEFILPGRPLPRIQDAAPGKDS